MNANKKNSRPKQNTVSPGFIGPLAQSQRRRGPTRRTVSMQPSPNSAPFADRRIDAPVASTSIMRGNTSTNAVPFPLRRKEYVADIAGSVAFTATKFSLNPGLSATFPWGAGIAPSFEEYDSVTVALHYEPESASSATGTVILAFDFDAADATPTTKQEALTFADNVRAAPWVPATLVLKTVDLRKRGPLYVRTGTVASTDIKTYDLGNAYVCTSGQVGTTTIGEFWISYHFNLRVPQPTNLSAQFSAKFVGAGGSIADTTYLGTTPTKTGLLDVTGTGKTITWNSPGQFLMTIQLGGTTLTSTDPTITGTATTTSEGPCADTGGTFGTYCFIVNVTAVGQTTILDFNPSSVTVTSSTVRIGAYAYALS